MPSPQAVGNDGKFLSPPIHKFANEFIHSGLSAVRQAHRPEVIEGLSEPFWQFKFKDPMP